MFCRNCGKEIDDGALFCPHCGSQTLNPSGTQPQAQPQVQPMTQQTVNVQPFNAGPAQEAKGTNGFGIAGFVLGLLSL